MKEGKQTVIVALREGIELVIVATAAAQGQPQPDGGRRIHAIYAVFGQVFLCGAAFLIEHVVAVKAGRDKLVMLRLGQPVRGPWCEHFGAENIDPELEYEIEQAHKEHKEDLQRGANGGNVSPA